MVRSNVPLRAALEAPMTDGKSEASAGETRGLRALIAVSGAAALVGYFVGAQGLVPVELLGPSTSTPLTRVGFALRAKHLGASEGAWDLLRGDVRALRLSSTRLDPRVFELVVALRGLESGGHSEWTKAEGICRELHWSRCDRPSLEQLERQSRP